METNKTARFGLMRHAETFWNLEKRIQGQSDSALTAQGQEQAILWGRVLKDGQWNRILTSDTGRALETAKIINSFLKISLITDSRLREQHWGQWTGKTIAEIKAEEPQVLAEQENAGWSFQPPGGEDRKRVLQRSQKALKDFAEKWPAECILVVTHEGVIKSLLYHFCGRLFLPEEPPLIRPNHLHWLIFDRNTLDMEKINALALG
jgi:probable phosphoglycerate mutase